MNKIIYHIENLLEVFENYIDKVFELINPPYDPCGSIAFRKRFSYEDRCKISQATDELKRNPNIKYKTITLEKETITITINY